MIIGILLLSVAFISSLVSAVSYYIFHKNRDEKYLQLANNSFYLTGVSLVFIAGMLLYNILIHNFQLNYVYSYSSRSLNTFYLVSTFWAGQEGTFILWLLFGTVYGLILIKTIARKSPLVLFFHMLVQVFILFILLKKNPFAMIWHVHSEAPVGFTPQDGAGLNPLLQNPWMVIHPPTLFVGYSSTMVLFAFAAAALVNRNFQGWIKMVRPWVMFTVMVLGAGIILGGYWAYATLGWGGYWAWDPVENSSLVPWLLSAVLLHGVIIQSKLRGLVKTNLMLAGATFITVLWGSFLTRSGVLSDFSVHSFAESGLNFYLIAFVLLFTGIFLYLYVRNIRGVESPKLSDSVFSRETFIFLGMMSVLFTAIIVLIGTASPIYTGLFGNPASVSPDFYNTVGIPIAVFMFLAVAIAPILTWQVSEIRNKNLLFQGLIVAFFTTLIGVILGIEKISSIALFFLSVFVIFTNSVVSYQILRKNFAKAGGYLTHVGLGFMLIGIVVSSMYDRSEKVTLPLGDYQKTDLGYELKFLGFMDMPNGKDRVKVEVKTDYGNYEAAPQFYYSDYTRSYMASPDVRMQLTKDIYISPISFMPAELAHNTSASFKKGETKEMGDFRVTFNRFDVDMQTDKQLIKGVFTVAINENSYWTEHTVIPSIWVQGGQRHNDEVIVPGTAYRVKITAVNAGAGTVELSLLAPAEGGKEVKDMLAVEISEKPLINILWFGTFLLIGGVFASMVYRIKNMN